uniref:Helicase ATP-binding domain-containing protein n=1 Tax=Compsopogon caeruleus TaxID=31354 RepID=A0A7S1T6E9_9RHOD|mmetsp:Transcript_11524/g.23443  ORF Transcript_11524/g.23443 Transcript_11524/m.23443 type:complete len:443 (+) Transcript_11524:1032-2360(+)
MNRICASGVLAKEGRRFQTLLGATGTGKTFVMAQVIRQYGRPALVIAPNKTLAGQLCDEFRSFFPESAVEYFVSYYDYYQPEAYVSSSDTYIEKASSINEDIDRLRMSATRALFERKDVIIVASVSCIYSLGMPSAVLDAAVKIRVGGLEGSTQKIARKLVNLSYSRNDTEPRRGRFRIRGDVLDIGVAWERNVLYRVELSGSIVESISEVDLASGNVLRARDEVTIYPARLFVAPEGNMKTAIESIQAECDSRAAMLLAEGKALEAERLKSRVKNDLEMLETTGHCTGIENYSRHVLGRQPDSRPETLLDYFRQEWLLFVDESHVTLPQVKAMWNGDRARKENLIHFGFRLPSALDNRPLRYEEFMSLVHQAVFVSATPGNVELSLSEGRIVEQLIRPTGILDPRIRVIPTAHQVRRSFGYLGLWFSESGTEKTGALRVAR